MTLKRFRIRVYLIFVLFRILVFLKVGNFVSYILDHVLLMLQQTRVSGHFYFFIFSTPHVAVREHCFGIIVCSHVFDSSRRMLSFAI